MHKHNSNCNDTEQEKLDNETNLSQDNDLAKMVQTQVLQNKDLQRKARNKRKASRRKLLDKATSKYERRLARK